MPALPLITPLAWEKSCDSTTNSRKLENMYRTWMYCKLQSPCYSINVWAVATYIPRRWWCNKLVSTSMIVEFKVKKIQTKKGHLKILVVLQHNSCYLLIPYRIPILPLPQRKSVGKSMFGFKEIWLIEVCVTCCLLIKPKVSMMSLCSTAAPDCCTGQSKGRYSEQYHSILVVVVVWL